MYQNSCQRCKEASVLAQMTVPCVAHGLKPRQVGQSANTLHYLLTGQRPKPQLVKLPKQGGSDV